GSLANQEMRSSRNSGTQQKTRVLSLANQEMRSSRNMSVGEVSSGRELSKSGNALQPERRDVLQRCDAGA
ncbi:MAG TPA: hypothetical protein PKN91_10010, partial [Steroidobacteraceae bacterium]|nr:hypothetical protein [Steroidobacteraceae bacterium]